MGIVRTIAALLFIIALPVALATTNVRIAVNEPRVYEYAADEYDTPARTGIEREELLRASGEVRDYFNNDEDAIFIRVQKDGQPISLFSTRETLHMQDVKNIMLMAFRVQELSVLFVLAYVVAIFIWAREGSLRSLARHVLISGALSLAIIAGAGALAVTGFDAMFERFHLIAFDNDLWQLDPARDHLIQMFPEAFWQDISIWVGIGTMVELGALAFLAIVYLVITRNAQDDAIALPPATG